MRLIDADAAIDAVNEYLRLSELSKTVRDLTSIQEILASFPTALPKKGKWIGADYDWGIGIYMCDQCGRFAMAKSDFCPNCGADMRGENNG